MPILFEAELAKFIWPPHPPSGQFPRGWQDDPHWHPEPQSLSCPLCDFQVQWIITAEGFPTHNDQIRAELRDALRQQHQRGTVPIHPWPGPTVG